MPDKRFDVVVAGAGLAGCCVSLRLARLGHRVLLIEKKKLPVHKLCGEFLSPESRDVFKRLGVLRRLMEAGAHRIDTFAATAPGNVSISGSLPRTALGLSRYQLDHILAMECQRAGVQLLEGTAVTDVQGDLPGGFQIAAGNEEFEARAVVGAYGKRGLLDRNLGRDFLNETQGTVAFKAHFEGRMPPHQVELHAFEGGYCGVQRVEADRVNVCWIGNSKTLKEAGGTPADMLRWSADANSMLKKRLAGLCRVTDPFLAISQVYLRPKSTFERDVCMIGDTAGMIAPMWGDGMAMALDSGDMAATYLDEYLSGRIQAKDLRQIYARAWNDRFVRRMTLGRWLHHAYKRPPIARTALRLCRWLPLLRRWIIRETRG